jgi:alpha 1,2-mannosyltransferase
MKFFEFLDSKGGFYYEVLSFNSLFDFTLMQPISQRWGDAPVHSIGAALFAHKHQIHFFEDIGYRHEPFQHCPQGKSHAKGKCWCSVNDNFGRCFRFLTLKTGSSTLLNQIGSGTRV